MADPTLTALQILNKVLVRLREDEVAALDSTAYSDTLTGFLNDSKRIVEDAFNWTALRKEITLTTAAGTKLYTLSEGSVYASQRSRVLHAYNTTTQVELLQTSYDTIVNWQKIDTTQAEPTYWAVGPMAASTQVPQIMFHHIPGDIYTIEMEVVTPTDDITSGSDLIVVPWHPVFLHTLALAIEERGEDGGTTSNSVFARYDRALADAIAYEQRAKYAGQDSFCGDWHVESNGF